MPDASPEKRTVVITSSETATPQPPRVPEYELLRCVGCGAFGEVWLAKNVMGTYRAIKIVYRNNFKDDGPFEREFNGIRRFETVSGTHPGLLNVLHVGRNDAAGYFYYVMEVADDDVCGQSFNPHSYKPRTLASEMGRRSRLPQDECVSLGLSLTSALEHLHRNGLIHRDIKPANIIFVKGVPKLADVGLVTEIGAQSLQGTPGYIPPEGPGEPSGDVFSLGKLLYTISTGKGLDAFPELPSSLGSAEIDQGFLEINKIILRACEHNVEKRYPSAQSMHADLELISRGKPVPKSHGWLSGLSQRLFSPGSQVPKRSPAKRHLSIVIRISFTIVLLGIVVPFYIVPNFVRSRELSQENSIFNNLRIIEGAKDQWALENKKGPGDRVTEEDLAPFLRGGKILPVIGETYSINPIGTPAAAKAPIRVGNYPPGAPIKAAP